MAAKNGAVVLQVEDARKDLKVGEVTVNALRGVSLSVKRGEFVAIVGPSGSGKSTLLGLIGGLDTPTAGSVMIDGVDITRLSERALTRIRNEKIGFVFQQFNLLPTLTAAENVTVPLLINRVPRSRALAKAGEMLARVGLGDRTKALPSQLSGGQQQRVAIARAMVHEPKLIVCDEPTSALDHETGHKVMELLREVALGPDRALVIVTHDARIFQFADRIAKMDDGRVVKVVNSPNEM